MEVPTLPVVPSHSSVDPTANVQRKNVTSPSGSLFGLLPVTVAVSWTAVPGVTAESETCVVIAPEQCASCPVTKSFSCEPIEFDVRVSARKVEKHESARPKGRRSMPPSKKCPTGKKPVGPTFGVKAHGEISTRAFVVPQRESPFGTLGGPTQSAGVMASPAIRHGFELQPGVTKGTSHLKTLTVAFAPLAWKSVRTRMSLFR